MGVQCTAWRSTGQARRQGRSALEEQLEGKLDLMLAVQSPTWSSEGRLGVLGEQFEGPTGAQDAPRGAQDAQRDAQEAPS